MSLEDQRAKNREYKRKQRERDAQDPERKHRKLNCQYLFGEVEISIITDVTGQLWFKGVDVARALDMISPNVEISIYVPNNYKKSFQEIIPEYHRYSDIHPKTTFITEMGLKRFVMRSKMPKSDQFIDWIFEQSAKQLKKMELEKEDLKLDMEYMKRKTDLDKEYFEKKSKHFINKIEHLISTIRDMKSNCVPQLTDRKKTEYLVIVKKVDEYYGCRIQECNYSSTMKSLRKQYPNLKELLKIKTPNSVNAFNYLFEQLPFIKRKGTNTFQIENVSETECLTAICNLYRATYGINVYPTIKHINS